MSRIMTPMDIACKTQKKPFDRVAPEIVRKYEKGRNVFRLDTDIMANPRKAWCPTNRAICGTLPSLRDTRKS